MKLPIWKTRFNHIFLEILKFNSIYLPDKKGHVGKITFERIKKSHKMKREKEFVRSKGQSWKATHRKQEIALECRVMFERVKGREGGERHILRWLCLMITWMIIVFANNAFQNYRELVPYEWTTRCTHLYIAV